MMTKWEPRIGDRVVLKSGGPTMEIRHVYDDHPPLRAACAWYDVAGELCALVFPVAALRLVTNQEMN